MEMDSITLNGVITGECVQNDNEFEGFYNKASLLIDRFSKSFGDLAILEELPDHLSYLYSGRAIVRAIDFPESYFAGLLPYSITFDLYKEEDFINYGILDPSQEIQFQQNDNGTVTINKSTSARGLNTDLKALDNARSFVQQLKGWNSSLSPLFIDSTNVSEALLIKEDEEVDRANCVYSLNETWLYDPYGQQTENSFYRVTTTINSGAEGNAISLEGTLEGRAMSSWLDLRQEFTEINFLQIAEEAYFDAGFEGELFIRPIGKSISENANEKSISFSMEYSDTILEDPYITDNFRVTWDIQNNKKCASAQVLISSIDECYSARWNKVNDFYETFQLKDWIDQRWQDYGYEGNLSNSFQSKSVSFDQKSSTISISATLCEKKIVIPAHLDDINYNVQIIPSMPTYIPFQGLDCGGAFTVQKLKGLKRQSITIQGDALISDCSTKEQALESLKLYINSLKFQYLNGGDAFMSGNDIRYGSGAASKKIYFSFSWNEKKSTSLFGEELLNSPI